MVPLIEKSSHKSEDIIYNYLKNCKNIDTILLGCTHYELISNLINKITHSHLISSSKEVAKELLYYLESNQLLGNNGKIEIYTTGEVQPFYKVSKQIINCKVKHIDLEVVK